MDFLGLVGEIQERKSGVRTNSVRIWEPVEVGSTPHLSFCPVLSKCLINTC